MSTYKSEITVNTKNDRFFMGIGKSGNHSFVFLGVMNNDIPFILARVGKVLDLNNKFIIPNAYLDDEIGFNMIGISYTAYSISYDQYIKFTELLTKAIPEIDKYCCYLPVSSDNDTVKLKKTRGFGRYRSTSKEIDKILTNTTHITPCNTCRHTAIDLLEYTQGTNEARKHVYSFFFRDLLLKNNIDKYSTKKPDNHFYIFPPPPSAHRVEPKTKAILTKLYTRMHELLKKAPYSEETINKFNALDELYRSQAKQPTDNINSMLNSILEWKQVNLKAIKPLRQQGMFGQLLNFFNITYKSSTESMADEIESSLKLYP